MNQRIHIYKLNLRSSLTERFQTNSVAHLKNSFGMLRPICEVAGSLCS